MLPLPLAEALVTSHDLQELEPAQLHETLGASHRHPSAKLAGDEKLAFPQCVLDLLDLHEDPGQIVPRNERRVGILICFAPSQKPCPERPPFREVTADRSSRNPPRRVW